MKKITLYSLFLAGLLAAGAFSSCKRSLKDQEYQGKEIVAAPAGFTGVVGSFTACDVDHSCLPLDDTTTSVPPNNNKLPIFGGYGASAFYNAAVAFHATLSHRVTWFITIKGRKSGAIQRFSGTSQVIDENTLLWKGRTEEGFLLGGEVCDITLSFLNSELTSSLILKTYDDPIFGTYDYGNNVIAPVVKAKVQDNYDFIPVTGNTGMRTTYSDINDGNVKATFILKNDKKAQGDFSLYMHGTDFNGNGYLGGFATENLTELAGPVGFPGRISADSFYYNAYVYGYGRPNACLMFLLYESDNNTGTYTPAIDDNWQYIQEITWTGWKLVSIRFSDFKPASNPASGGNGNRIREPYKLVGAAMELQSYPVASQEVEANVDYVIFTYGGPLVK